MMATTMLEEIKLLKGITDSQQDSLLKLIIEESEQRILSYINNERSNELTEYPEEIKYILRDVAIARFNRLDSEGSTKHSREGENFDWSDYLSANHEKALQRYMEPDESQDKSKPGLFRVIF